MNLSKRLTFSIFSILFVAALVVTPTAMAQVTVTAYQEITAATTTAGETIVITLTYSEDPNPRPVLADFTAADNQITEPDDDPDTERDVLTAAYNDGADDITVALGGEGKTVTLTFTGPAGDGTDVGEDIDLPTELRLKGYTTNLNTANDRIATPTADLITLNLESNYIPGKAYIVYAHGTDATTLVTPATILPTSIIAAPASDGSPGAVVNYTVGTATVARVQPLLTMPDDLEEFFNVGGGTIDLVVRTGTGTTEDPYVAAAGERDVVINEIMWGLDNSRVGQSGHTHQQWIEIHNRKTTPVPNPTFIFTDGDGSSFAPDKETGVVDRISNIADVQNVWNDSTKLGRPILGSNGTATRDDTATVIGANPPFVSVYRDKQDGDGITHGHWKASTRAYFPGFLGTPGAANTRGGFPTIRPNPEAYTPPKNKVIINEVGNYSDAGSDWIELRNVSDAEQNIKDWRLTHAREVTPTDDDPERLKETQIIKFPEIKIPAGEVLLFVTTAPSSTDLAEGFNIEIDKGSQRRGYGPHKYRILDFDIPEITSGFLILRSKPEDKYLKSRQHLHDAVGPSRLSHDTIASGEKEPESGNTYWKTNAWPINGHTGDNYRAHNAKDSNNNNASLDPAADFANNTVWERIGTNHGWRKDGGKRAVFTGGIGYDRGVNKGGTPGYHNDVVKGTVADIDGGQLIISELMLTTDNGRYPQWIELHNTSKTRGVNLAADGSDADGSGKNDGWRMIVENHNSGKWATAREDKTVVTINLKDLFTYIPPNQTVLIVSDNARNSGTNTKIHFPSHRVASIWDTKKADFLMASRRDIFLNAKGGFYIKIVDGGGAVSDEVGNLDGEAADVRAGVPYDDPFGWTWPTDMANRNERTSLIRLRNDDGTPRAGTPIRPVDAVADDPATDADETVDAVEANPTRGAVLPMNTKWRGNGMVGMGQDMAQVPAKYAGYAWVHTVDVKKARAQDTWYGVDTDHGTPGHTTNTPLPVELSFFRPTALEDGKVVIQWTTESELNNAGFNILRSDSRDGEFKQVNEQMIQGKGTTGERSAYKWTDTSAKPGAVYYYQIEDVSFAGERKTLATTKLKGLISAKNKLTTTWGDLKSKN